jgi:hypothetical protein
MLKFKSWVKPQGLEITSEGKFRVNNEKIKPILDVELTSVLYKEDYIRISKYGITKIEFVEGNKTEAKREEGNVRIEIPKGVYDVYIQVLEGEKGILRDNLYYINQEIEKKEKDMWYRLGKREIPLPKEIGSGKYEIELENKGIRELRLRIYNGDKVEYPIGMKEIGEEGGIVDLEGVGKLYIPKGAITSKVLVKVSQELNHSKEVIVKSR